MTEADENTLRNLLTRLREEDPRAFLDVLSMAVLAPMVDNSIASIRVHGNRSLEDHDERLSAMILVFKGEQVAAWADTSEKELRSKLMGGQ